MPLPRVLSYVFIYCCDSGTTNTDYRLRQTHRQNREKLLKRQSRRQPRSQGLSLPAPRAREERPWLGLVTCPPEFGG